MKKLAVLIVLNFLLCIFANAQCLPEFDKAREIKLLEMNRDDVRKIFAEYKSDNNDDSSYFDWFETANADIQARYSEGNCDYDIFSNAFNVSKWKVEHLEITFNNPIKVEETGIDFTKYRKERWYSDNNEVYAYYDKDKGIIFRLRKNEVEGITLIPSPKYYNLMCDNEKAKIPASNKSIFSEKLKNRKSIIVEYSANVEKLNLSKTEVLADCDSNDKCSKSNKTISVSTIAIDPEGDVLTYAYTISGGRIIGQGSKVVWDLSGVKPGTYIITAAVDDGCGFCGMPKTKIATVKECPDCVNK